VSGEHCTVKMVEKVNTANTITKASFCRVINFMYGNLSEDGQCFSWGCGKHGVLGHGDTSDRLHP